MSTKFDDFNNGDNGPEDGDKIKLIGIIGFVISAILLFIGILLDSEASYIFYCLGGIGLVFNGFIMAIVIKDLVNANKNKHICKTCPPAQHLHENFNDLDYDFFYSDELGEYKYIDGNRRISGSIAENFVFRVENVYKAIIKYYEISNASDYIVQFHTKKLLSATDEKLYRTIAKECHAKIAFETDISSLLHETPDHHVITVKASHENIKTILLMIKETDIESVVIVDDYNPSVFTNKDKYKAFNYNYRIKIAVFSNSDTNKTACQIILVCGMVKDHEKFLQSLARSVGGRYAQVKLGIRI